MRLKRVTKFKKHRRKKFRKLIVFSFILPITSLFVAYIIATLIILPSMVK